MSYFRMFLWVVLATLPSASAQDGAETLPPQLSRQPYLQAAAQDGITIVWRTLGDIRPVLRYGVRPDALTRVVDSEGILVRRGPQPDVPDPGGVEGNLGDMGEAPDGGAPLEEEVLLLDSSPLGTFQYEAKISDLGPNQRWYYGVFDGDLLLAGADESHYFNTLPAAADVGPWRFWVVGDSGDGSLTQQGAFEAMRRQTLADGKPLDAYLHLGDMAYNFGEDDDFQANFFDIYSSLLRNTVTWPTMGNHEGYSALSNLGVGPYYDAFVMPTKAESGGAASGTEAYYSFDYGRTHFVCLNSHDISRSLDGEMVLWLKEDLARTNADWLIAFWHHPPYTKGTHDSDAEFQLVEMRENIMPLLETAGVDLVLCGHSHTYERSMLINGAYVTPTRAEGVVLDDGDGDPLGNGAYRKSAQLNPNDGTVAVVAGHGRGAAQYYGLMPVMRRTIPEAGSVIMDIDGNTVTLVMLNSIGEIRDRFQIIKSGRMSTREPIDYPWQPFGPTVITSQPAAGKLVVSLRPSNQASDAAIYYTTDGSQPTSASSRYERPFAVGDATVVSAITIWRDGTRFSPVTTTQPLFSAQQNVVRLPILDPADDAVEVAGDLTSLAPSLTVASGPNAILGFRFPNAEVPRGVTIARAYMQFSAAKNESLPGTLEFRGDLTPGSPAFSDLSLISRTKTKAVATWTLPVWPFAAQRSTAQRTPDLSLVLQEIIDDPQWTPGAPLTLFASGDGSHAVRSGENDPGSLPELVLLYEKGTPIEIAARQRLNVRASPRLTEVDLQYPEFVFRRWRGASAAGQMYLLEGTDSLEKTPWEPVTELNAQLGSVQGAWETVLVRVLQPIPSEGPRRFYRLRVVQTVP